MLEKLKAVKNKYFSDDVVYIYQMGKVGSSSLEKSIENSVHIHSLFSNHPCMPWYRRKKRGVHRLFDRMKDFVKVKAIRSKKKVKIITLVREPVDRNFSMFFQDLPFWYAKYMEKYDSDISRQGEGIEVLYEIYKKVFPHSYCQEWFDKEIKRLTGIDVYQRDFDPCRGVAVHQNDKYQLLVLDMKRIGDNWETVQDFIGEEVELVESNRSSEKWYDSVYAEFKKKYKDNRKDIEGGLNKKYVDHFYGAK